MNIKLEDILPGNLDPAVGGSEIWSQNINFSTPQIVNITAPSGRGKTTFISLLYGVRRNYVGSVWFDREEIKNFSLHRWAQIRQSQLAIVFQSLRLLADLSAWDNIMLNAMLTPPADTQRIQEYARDLRVQHLLKRPCRQMSMGEQQRVALIRALAQPFSWLLADEPFSHLDAATIKIAAKLIESRLGELNAGLIITSLDPNEHFPYTQKVLL